MLIALTLAWLAIGAPVSLITQIAIYMLYGAGVNLLVVMPVLCLRCFIVLRHRQLRRGNLDDNVSAVTKSRPSSSAILFSLVLATAVALFVLRRRGLYFSLLTLAFSQLAFEIAFKWTDLTGGENGLQDVPRT